MEQEAEEFMRTLDRIDYRREAEITGKSVAAAIADSLRASDEPPPEEGWYPPAGEGSWAALSLRQRLAAVYLSEDRDPEETAERLDLRMELIKEWERRPTFRRAVAQRRLHQLRRSSISALRDTYETQRAIRLRIVGVVDPASPRSRKE
jgi:hypothetical protein